MTEDEVEYPPRQHQQESKFASKHQCSLCQRPLPFSPFSGIGWRDAMLEPGKRSRICNECFINWRKTHPPAKHESNTKLWNKVIMVCGLVLALYGMWSFTQIGSDWMSFLTGTGVILIIGGLFLYIFHGIINKRIDFVPPSKPEKGEKRKFEFNFPNPMKSQSIIQPNPREEVPTTLEYDDAPSLSNLKCDICGLEKLEDELFVHPDGFRICNDCIARKKHYETNHN